MKAVIYARYSSDHQREESIEGQLRECTEYAKKKGITIVRHYIDRAFSAKTDNRPEFQNMIKDSNKKVFDMIIVWKLDRFSRNRYDSARYKALLRKNGVKVVSATESISEGAEGIILESVLEGYAEYYSADLSEKVIRGMTENVLKGKYNGGTMPLGYYIDEDMHYQLDPLVAPFIKETYQKYLEGESMIDIAEWLNSCGVTNTKGGIINHQTVKYILENRKYIGELKFRDVVLDDMIPAIVDKDIFEQVQVLKIRNKKVKNKHGAPEEYLLTPKLFCGYCGESMNGESGTSRNGTVNRYYKCRSLKKKLQPCEQTTVKKEWIEEFVGKTVKELVMDDKAIEHIVTITMELQKEENKNIPVLEKQLSELDVSIDNIITAIQQGIFTKATKAKLDELENKRTNLVVQLADEKVAKTFVTEEYVRNWLRKFRNYDIKKKTHLKMLIETFVQEIHLYNDKMLIIFNCRGGQRTVPYTKRKKSNIKARGEPKRKSTRKCALFFLPFLLVFKSIKVCLWGSW